jgi:O-antigen ligase
MSIFISVLCVITIVISLLLVILRPVWVFYLFLAAAAFNSILAGYIYRANNLGLPATWAPADFLSGLTLLAALFVPCVKCSGSSVIRKMVFILVLLSVFSLLQGLVISPRDALTHSRVVHFAAAAVFALRYFTDYDRVKGFLRFCVILLLMMFGLHILVRFGLYQPPISETERLVEAGGLIGERGTRSLIPMFYLVLVGFALGRISSRAGSFFISVLLLLVGLGGVVLSETRSTYGALAVMLLVSLIFLKGRVKISVIFVMAGLIAVFAATALGFDFLARFRTNYGQGDYSMPSYYQYRQSWRGIEYETIASSYKQQPYFLLTGRGVGAMHPAAIGVDPQVAFYHSEYLGWLDRCGLLGLAALLVLLFACLWKSFALARSDVPYLRSFGAAMFLLMTALAAEGFFHPVFSHYRAASLLICFVVILANWQQIYLSLPEQQEFAEEEQTELEPAAAGCDLQ